MSVVVCGGFNVMVDYNDLLLMGATPLVFIC